MLYVRYFKYSKEMEEDQFALTNLVKNEMSYQTRYSKGIIFLFRDMQTGEECLDFIKGLKTCVLRYDTFKAPRFSYPQKRRVINKFHKHYTRATVSCISFKS